MNYQEVKKVVKQYGIDFFDEDGIEVGDTPIGDPLRTGRRSQGKEREKRSEKQGRFHLAEPCQRRDFTARYRLVMKSSLPLIPSFANLPDSYEGVDRGG